MVHEEVAEAYLKRANLKPLFEWLTAECILSEAKDPLAFCQFLLTQKLEDRGLDKPYDPWDADSYLRQCYSEEGPLNGSSRNPISPSAFEGSPCEPQAVAKALHHMMEPKTVEQMAGAIKLAATQAFSAQQVLVHIVVDGDSEKTPPKCFREIGADLEQDSHPISPSCGFLWKLTEGGESCAFPSIKETEKDSMCATLGLSSLQTLICGPLRTAKGSILGWLTIANKKQGRYTEKDLVAFSVLASAASISLEHADHFQKNESERARLSSMMDIFQAVHDRSTHMSHHRLLFVMTDSLPKICEAHRCTCFVVDHSEKQELWSIQGDINIRMPIDVGIAGAVATSGEHIHIDDAYMDPRFNRQFDMDTGYRTKAVLAMPLFSSSGKVLAVLQFINKCVCRNDTSGVFTEKDALVLKTFLGILGPFVESSPLFNRREGRTIETEMEFPNLLRTSSSPTMREKSRSRLFSDIMEAGEEDGTEYCEDEL